MAREKVQGSRGKVLGGEGSALTPNPSSLSPSSRPTSDGLRDAFALCPICAQAVLVQVAKTVRVEWHNPQTDADETLAVLRWERPAVALDPVQGADHPKRCPEAAGLRPLWIKDGKGGERFAWMRLETGEILETPRHAASA